MLPKEDKYFTIPTDRTVEDLRNIIENYQNETLNSIKSLPIEIKKQQQFFDFFDTIMNRKL